MDRPDLCNAKAPKLSAFAMYRTLLVVLVCTFSLLATAQRGIVAGTISSNENGKIEPMPFVNVALKGTNTCLLYTSPSPRD